MRRMVWMTVLVMVAGAVGVANQVRVRQMSLNQIVSYIPKVDKPGKGGKWDAGAREAARRAVEQEVVGKLYKFQITVGSLSFNDGECSIAGEHERVGDFDCVLEAPTVHMSEAQVKALGIKKNGRAQLTGKVSKVEFDETGQGKSPWFRMTVTLGVDTVIAKWRSE